jgi:hypothetical protein
MQCAQKRIERAIAQNDRCKCKDAIESLYPFLDDVAIEILADMCFQESEQLSLSNV